ncbi:MAG: DUF11 domain-containing protein [Calothrix sp. FI2-JRJ7]|jgi:uncharacterized repeat protein (TIGR01451 family)|nr:DUF11 domain-containing protein [Calothrix sp. FI2-JRJ7]
MKLIKTIGSLTLLLTSFSSQILLEAPVTAQTATPLLCAVPGKDGSSTLAGVINTYYAGAGTASAGAPSITLGAINPNGSQTPIAAGDLLLIIQMQGADINSTNSDSYGSGTPGKASGNINDSNFTAGNYEYVVATSAASGGVVSIRGAGSGSGLINSYINAPADNIRGQRTYQVIRVPQYSNATLGGTLTAAPWNGSSGGVLVYDVAGNLNLGGANMDVSSKGFRGGGGIQLNQRFTPAPVPNLLNTDFRTRAPSSINSKNGANGSKGEGTAGTPRYTLNPIFTSPSNVAPNNFNLFDNGSEGYPDGSFGRGAPGNAGGGSTDGNPEGLERGGRVNEENSGGGGGGNGGLGGKGGKPWKSGNPPLNLDTGGFGGDKFSVANRIVMGGGGGAGTNNDATSNSQFFPDNTDGRASSGAPGGGIVLLRTGRVSGTGEINANGTSAFNVKNDGGGGGGAGGTVVVTAANNSLAGLTVNANGGNGGSAVYREPHGPGGGGGGGVILTSPGSQRNANGGRSGGTSDPVDPRINFGATGGDSGITSNVGSIPGANSGADCVPQLTVNKTTSTPRITNKPGKAVYTITVSNAANRATATNVNISDPLPTGFTFDASTPPTVTLIDSPNEPTARNNIINPAAGATTVDFGTFNIPGGGSVQITFSVDVGVNVPDNTYNNDAIATYIDPTLDTPGSNPTTTNIARSRYDGNASTTEDVVVSQIPTPPPPPTPIINMRAIKRITNVTRNDAPLAGLNFNAVIDDPGDTNDDASIWANSPLAPIGVTRIDPQLKLGVGDEVEYTVYFLVDGNQPISNARFCDPIPQGTSFINSSGSDIALNVANTITNQTNVADADRASLVNAVAPLPANNVCPNQSNPTGAVLVNFGTLDFTPGNNFGYVRFRVRVE